MSNSIKMKHDALISLMIELLAEVELEDDKAVFPAELYHLMSERMLEYVRSIQFTTDIH